MGSNNSRNRLCSVCLKPKKEGSDKEETRKEHKGKKEEKVEEENAEEDISA